MFFYISFLRPPPLQSSPSKAFSITPQIANDLRTELYSGTQDLFFSWSHCTDPANTTKPAKLTTWRLSSAYKEISVPLPHGVRDGQSWRLILSAHSGPASEVISLLGHGMGNLPFPVMSMPILFSSRNLPIPQKQEQIERVYRFARNDRLVSLIVREQTSFDLDKKIWDSGIGLSSWIVDRSCDVAADIASNLEGIHDVLFSAEPRKVLELGAGTGIAALTLAALRSSADDTIITTDLPSAMPLLTHNLTANSKQFVDSAQHRAAVLDWDQDLPSEIRGIGGFDFIMMADVTYNTTSFPALISTLKSLIRLCPMPPLILLGYKERDPEERTLWDLTGQNGIQLKKVGEKVGCGGGCVEVWVGKVC